MLSRTRCTSSARSCERATTNRRARRAEGASARVAAIGLLLAGVSGTAAESNGVNTAHVRAMLVSEVAAVTPGSSFWIGLRFEIRPGWHTYWTNPGDSGLATSIEWQLPDGMVAGDIRWPVPQRFRVGGLMNYGYADEVVLLTRMSPWPRAAQAGSVTLIANARWLVCEEICVPEEGRFERVLPVSSTSSAQPIIDPEGQRIIGEYARLLPTAAPRRARFIATPESIRLEVPVPGEWPRQASDVWFFPDRYGVIDHAASQSVVAGENGFELTLSRGAIRDESPVHLRGVLMLRYGESDVRGISVDAEPG